jgi:hypothetical protein
MFLPAQINIILTMFAGAVDLRIGSVKYEYTFYNRFRLFLFF